jgi:hypothetical protein
MLYVTSIWTQLISYFVFRCCSSLLVYVPFSIAVFQPQQVTLFSLHVLSKLMCIGSHALCFRITFFKTFCPVFKTTFYWLLQILNYMFLKKKSDLRVDLLCFFFFQFEFIKNIWHFSNISFSFNNITFLFYLQFWLFDLLPPANEKTTVEGEGRFCGPDLQTYGCLSTNSYPYLADIHAADRVNEEEHMSKVSHWNYPAKSLLYKRQGIEKSNFNYFSFC